MIRTLFSVFVPLGMLAASWIAVIWMRLVPPRSLDGIAYGAMALAALACWRFKRSRALLPLGYLALCLWVSGRLGDGAWAAQAGAIAYPALALLLPLNWCLAVLVGDRGGLSRLPLALAALAAVQAAVVLFVITGGFGAYEPLAADAMQSLAADRLHTRLVPLPLDVLSRLPQPALLAGLACVLGLAGRGAFVDEPMDAGLAVALGGALGTLHFAGMPPQAAAMALGSALAVAAPLVQDSYRMAFLDELTGLPARRSLLADMRTLGGSFAVAMADVDHFKKFNDTWGHDTGDEVLRMVAAHLGRVGGGGRAYRYGGEEFTILFPRRDPADAVQHLEAVREAIAGAAFTVRKGRAAGAKAGAKGKGAAKGPAAAKAKSAKTAKAAPTTATVNVTISMGVAGPGGPGAGSPQEVLQAADKALYAAKKKGRNRVEKA